MLLSRFYMEQAIPENIFIITSLLAFIMASTVITLFVVFQRRKNKLLQEQEAAQKKFEKEIAETQIEIREQTLRNISWELHDNIGQLLTLAKIQLQSATEENIDEVSKTITKSLTELRTLSKLINPEALNNIRLQDAIQLEIDRFNRLQFVKSSLEITGEPKALKQKSEIIIFRILQEFFANTIKHSKAMQLDVKLTYSSEELRIEAKDNGVGFAAENVSGKGIGLLNMQNRAKLINAHIDLTSSPNQGTMLVIQYKL